MIGWNLSDLPANLTGPRVMTTFSCGGGSSMGYKLAGCNVVAANDIDPEMKWHYVENLKPNNYYLDPIGKLLNDSYELTPELFDLDILDGSPPCSSFSMAGNREKDWQKKKKFKEGQATQVLDDLFFDYLNLVDKLRPKVSIAENVKGMLLGNAKGYLKQIFARYKEIGYRPQLFLIDAANCGVPQFRERVFFCAVREDVSCHRVSINPKIKIVTAGEAIGGLEFHKSDITNNFTATDHKYWPLTKEGGSYKEAAGGSFFGHMKLTSKSPSPTITSNTSLFTHWKEKRKFTFAELKRLASFPDDYIAKTPKIGGYMIGMSVPPFMAREVANAVIRDWLT